ncbi:stalk domain-containing protein [Priestia abyssalis]|uniref:stalk domain-containing protein n=1 Tax=Priestia abyssalis TaxID=1221450 RepID=UPI0009951D04|nr:stalk domain-containing protein [Priestia abyssalis]
MKKKLIAGIAGISLLSGGIGVYAGEVIKSYKTPRGNIATVEQENIHKNRIGLTVNGEEIKQPTWYHDQEKTYVPLRAVSEALGAKVNYNQETMSADITLKTTNDLKAYGNFLALYGDYRTVTRDIHNLHDNLLNAAIRLNNGDSAQYIVTSSDFKSIKTQLDNLMININAVVKSSSVNGFYTVNEENQISLILDNIDNAMSEYEKVFSMLDNFAQTGNIDTQSYITKNDYAVSFARKAADLAEQNFSRVENMINSY